MAFLLPLICVGSGVSGFVAGYYFNTSNTHQTSQPIDIDIHELKFLKEKSPHKEIHHELTTFDKNKLKKPTLIKPVNQSTREQEIFEELKQKISNRRNFIKPL